MRRTLVWIAVVVAVCVGGYSGAWYLLPLQMAELKNRWTLRSEGVEELESGGLKGFVKDTCRTASPQVLRAKGGCTCVALVHGLGDNAMTWKSVLAWPESGWLQPVKLVAFDQPGSGRTPAPADRAEYSVRKQAARLRAALAPHCPRWIVVGNSLGGWISSWLALDWPEGMSRLVLIGSAGLKTSESGKPASLLGQPTVESLKEFQRRAYFKGRPLPDHVWEAVARQARLGNSRAVMDAQRPEDYLDDRLASLRLPTLLLWGAADRISPPENGQRFRSLIRGSIWKELPECGHLPQKECPLEVIRAIGKMADYGGV